MFKFNFNIEEPGNSNDNEASSTDVDLSTQQANTKPAGKFSYQEIKKTKSKNYQPGFKRLYLDDDQTSYVEYLADVDLAASVDDDESTRLAIINQTHDVVSGEYEGGLKIWELSIDLAKLIYNDHRLIQDLSINEATESEFRVLELGCGHSLPSLSLLRLLEKTVPPTRGLKVVLYLQDFNKKVIEDLTFENVHRFTESSNMNLDVELVYGDWRRIISDGLLPTNYFDLILTTETIYNKSSYKPLLDIFRSCLRGSSSFVLLGAKTYYFGCSGHLDEFLKLARSRAYAFSTSANLLTSTPSCSNHAVNSFSKEIIKIIP